MEDRLKEHLDRRRRQGSLRRLMAEPDRAEGDPSSSPASRRHSLVDFSSNDYLGLARCPRQRERVDAAYRQLCREASDDAPVLGATGSRLLSGDSRLARALEISLARIHQRPAGLLCNSGYDANLSVLSSLPYRDDDVVVMDALAHNSLVMGARLGRLAPKRIVLFQHNDVADLERVLEHAVVRGRTAAPSAQPPSVLIVVESVYSMDGDVAPLGRILDVAAAWHASVIVDEAHGLGVYGRTNARDLCLAADDAASRVDKEEDALPPPREAAGTPGGQRGVLGGTGVLAALELERHPSLLCSVHTFGKAAGCHGAVVVGSRTLVAYLVNYARPFVYSTSLPPHSLLTIRGAYEAMTSRVGEGRRREVFRLVRLFRQEMSGMISRLKQQFPQSQFALLDSPSPIQAVVTPGNARCIAVSQHLRNTARFDVYPIRSPTVAKESERIRIILHSHNKTEEVLELTHAFHRALRQSLLHPGDILNTKARL